MTTNLRICNGLKRKLLKNKGPALFAPALNGVQGSGVRISPSRPVFSITYGDWPVPDFSTVSVFGPVWCSFIGLN